MLLLSDMGCFKGYRGVVVAHIEAADRTLIMCTLVAPPGGTSDRVDGKRCEYQNPSRQRCLPEYWSENAPQGSAAPACRLAYVFCYQREIDGIKPTNNIIFNEFTFRWLAATAG